MPLNNPAAGTLMKVGIYTGDSTVNKAIPHGLPRTPKLVVIVGPDGDNNGVSQVLNSGVNRVCCSVGGANSSLGVTAMDSTNFYVGNATNYNLSANMNAYPYKWAAFT